MRPISIRWRMTLWNTAAFAVVLAGFGVLVYSLLRQTHFDQVDRGLLARFQELVQDDQLAANPEEQFPHWVRRFGEHIEITGIVWDSAGRPVARAEQLQDIPSLDTPPEATAQIRFDSLTLPRIGHVRRMTAVVPTTRGEYRLVLLAELEHIDEELDQVLKTLLFTVPVTLLVAAALAYFLAYKALAPVEQLRQLTNELTAERLDQRLPVYNSGDELGLLAQTINSMIARLERSFDEVRRFTADASHELRTPLAVIRSEAELGGDASATLEDARMRFESILEECSRLVSVTAQLLTLSREDAGSARLGREVVFLSDPLTQAVESLRPMADARNQTLTLETESEASVPGDPDRLRQVFHNLIENAIKYTPGNGRIHVSLSRTNGAAVVTVEDDGIGIPPEHLSRIFDRFYRVNKSGGGETSGAGLGLSIVQSIVTSLSGRVEVESKVGKGSVFRVSFPLPAQTLGEATG